jgi:acyl-CoA reductase-like NAD-dependent aldehyde dehydrogenase
LSVFNPADGSLVADGIPLSGAEDVDLVVNYAIEAFENGSWRDMSANNRRVILQKFSGLVLQNASELQYITRITVEPR